MTKTGANQESEEAAGNVRTEEMITGVEDEGEIRTEERKEICAGTPLMATHAYTKNQESPVGKEIYLRQWDTLIFKGEHAEHEHWRLVEDKNGQVGYAPATFLLVILDTTTEEQERDATKKGQGNSTEDNRIGGRIGQEGERRKSYSAAVIDSIKRNTTIYVGDSIIRKTDSRLSKGKDVVVCLPGARIEHVTERVEKIMGRGNGGIIPANMLTLGQRRQALALEQQRRRWGDDVGPTLFRRRLATSQYDAKTTSGDDVGSTLFRRRLATSQYDAKPTSGDDVGSTLFRPWLATSQYDAKPTSGDDVGSTLFPRR